MSTFEDRLWSDLVSEHGDEMRAHGTLTDPSRRRRGQGQGQGQGQGRHRSGLLTGTALATSGAAVTAALVLTATTSAPPAYAVTTNPDGTVTVTLNDISALTGLNAELARDGIRAKAIALTATCPTRGFPGTMPAGTNPSTYTVTIDPADIPVGFTAIVAVSETASGRIQIAAGAWPNPGPSCLNTTPYMVLPGQR